MDRSDLDAAIDRAIRTARAHWQAERGEDGEPNGGPFIRELFRGARPRGNWCAAFVASCLEDGGVVPVLTDRERRGAKGLTKVIARLGRWVIEPALIRSGPTEEPEPGDVICWHLRGAPESWRGHVELVADYDVVSDHMITYAGNVGGYPAKVRMRSYPRGTWRRRLYGVARIIPTEGP